MVIPPALRAATPVGATTIMALSRRVRRLFKESGLSVPALLCQKHVGACVLQQISARARIPDWSPFGSFYRKDKDFELNAKIYLAIYMFPRDMVRFSHLLYMSVVIPSES